jgi:hypothetical protein
MTLLLRSRAQRYDFRLFLLWFCLSVLPRERETRQERPMRTSSECWIVRDTAMFEPWWLSLRRPLRYPVFSDESLRFIWSWVLRLSEWCAAISALFRRKPFHPPVAPMIQIISFRNNPRFDQYFAISIGTSRWAMLFDYLASACRIVELEWSTSRISASRFIAV